MSTPLDAYWQHKEGQRSIVTKPWFLLRPNSYVKFCRIAQKFSFPSELQEDRLNLEICWAGNHWFNFPKALFQILFYFPELTHCTPNSRRSLEKVERGCLCLFLLGWIQQWNSSQTLISWASTSEHSKLWVFLRWAPSCTSGAGLSSLSALNLRSLSVLLARFHHTISIRCGCHTLQAFSSLETSEPEKPTRFTQCLALS